jgi:outer membrane protein TolC
MSDAMRSIRLPLAATIAAGLLAPACQVGILDNRDDTWRAPPGKLKELSEQDLVGRSEKPPVSPEEATREALEGKRRLAEYDAMQDLSLAEVRAATLENNLELRTLLYDPAIAAKTLDAERAKFEMSLYGNYTNSGSNFLTDLALGNTVDQNNATAGLDIPLATGGDLKAFTTFQQFASGTPDFLDPDGDWQAGLGFSLSQPLLRGAGVTRNTASIRVADYQGQIANARTKLETIRILALADKAYWNLYGAFRELEVRKAQYDLAVSVRDQAKRRVDQGQVAEIEVIRAESGIGQRIEGIIVADANLRDRVRELKRIMNRKDLPFESRTMFAPVTPPNPLGLELDPSKLADEAVANRMEMLELELQLAIDATNLDVARNDTLPLFAVDFSYSPLGAGNSLGEAYTSIGNWDQDQYSVGVSGEIPLANDVAKSRLGRAVLERVQRLATRDQRRLAIRAETFAAVDKLRAAWLRILAARLETVLAARTLKGEERQFEVGLRTSQDVLDAQGRLADAQSREVLALSQYQIALIDIAFATGTLLGSAGVEFAPIDVEELGDRETAGVEAAVEAGR